MVEAVETVVVHLVSLAAMLHEGLGNYLRGGGGQCMHKQKVKRAKFCASLILNLSSQCVGTSHIHSLWLEELYQPQSLAACRRQGPSSSML